MKSAPDENAPLADLSRLVVERMGVYFPPSRWGDLERAFRHAAMDLGFSDQEECVKWFLASSPSREQIESLSVYLTTGETYFLREKRIFEILEQTIIPEIIRSRAGSEKRLRIWSAGCATGEEPYTLAIMLHRMGGLLRDWNVSILATDINPHALRKATEGVYTKWSFRGTPDWFSETYFYRKGDNHFELIPSIKNMVQFAYLNLAADYYPSLLVNTNAMDIIFCRNVLMYFTPERTGKVIERFRHCLVEGGVLVVSVCEVSNILFPGFQPVNFSDITLYRRQAGSYHSATTGNGRTSSFPLKTPAQESPPSLLTSPPQAIAPTLQQKTLVHKRDEGHKGTEPTTASPSIHHTNTGALVDLCRSRANEGQLQEALQLSEQALGVDKLDPRLHYLRGMILLEQGAFDEAEAALKRALYLDQDLVLAHFSLGNIALRLGKGQESRKHFQNALAIMARYKPEDLLPESEGISAGRLTQIIKAWLPACTEETDHEPNTHNA